MRRPSRCTSSSAAGAACRLTGDTQQLAVGDLVLIPPATDHSVANDGDGAPRSRLRPVAAGVRRRALLPPSRGPGERVRRLRGRVGRRPRPARRPLMVRKRVIVHGRVQGVFFRDTTRRTAESRGVTGGSATTRTAVSRRSSRATPRTPSTRCCASPARARAARWSSAWRSATRSPRA